MAVFDFCSFLNENDLYEIRLNQHWDFVDKFIVVEVGETHTGLPKELKFDHDRFKPYASKIHYVTFDNFRNEIINHPELLDTTATADRGAMQASADWTRCYFQDNYIVKVLKDLEAKDNDIVYASCLDEMIKKESFNHCLEIFKDKDSQYQKGLRPVFFFQMYLYAYKFNLLHKHWKDHYAAIMTEVGNFKKILPASLRHHSIMTHGPIPDAGWHFTTMDPTDGERVLEKYRSWAHSRDNFPGQKMKFNNTTKEEALERFFHDYAVKKVEITDQTHPKYIVDNIDKFQNLIYNKELK
jgi:beta-1,4-mannosyl-glycoprotein beta-1,4-N-acetylglucosaminyltransferase